LYLLTQIEELESRVSVPFLYRFPKLRKAYITATTSYSQLTSLTNLTSLSTKNLKFPTDEKGPLESLTSLLYLSAEQPSPQFISHLRTFTNLQTLKLLWVINDGLETSLPFLTQLTSLTINQNIDLDPAFASLTNLTSLRYASNPGRLTHLTKLQVIGTHNFLHLEQFPRLVHLDCNWIWPSRANFENLKLTSIENLCLSNGISFPSTLEALRVRGDPTLVSHLTNLKNLEVKY
jgi:hypothetical protein